MIDLSIELIEKDIEIHRQWKAFMDTEDSRKYPEAIKHAGDSDHHDKWIKNLNIVLEQLQNLKQIQELVKGWLNKQGHDQCWYYPDIFLEIAKIVDADLTNQPNLPSLAEFQEGCRKYQKEIYDRHSKCCKAEIIIDDDPMEGRGAGVGSIRKICSKCYKPIDSK